VFSLEEKKNSLCFIFFIIIGPNIYTRSTHNRQPLYDWNMVWWIPINR